MASPNIYQSGIGGTSGADLATAAQFVTSGYVWYVCSLNGSDAASPRGRERVRPLATLAQAITNASAADTIVCLSGHTETLTVSQSIAKTYLTILGEGTGSNRPRFTRNADINMFDITDNLVSLVNLYFPSSGTSTTKSKVRTASVRTRVIDCYFEAGSYDLGPQFEMVTGAQTISVEGTTFCSVSADITAAPESAIKVTNSVVGIDLIDVTVDGGSSGWSQPYAINGSSAIYGLFASNLRLIGDSDVTIATTSTGFITPVSASGGSSRIVWAA